MVYGKVDPESRFLSGLIELQYGQDVQEELKKVAQQVDWAKGWPNNNKSFWNAEAFMWSRKISKEKRELIKQELSFLKGNNLDLGCGAYSYVNSVGFDFSKKMLDFNDNLIEKVEGSLEKKLPYKEDEFDSVTAIFVLNYVKNYEQLLMEIKRIVKDEFIMVLFSKQVNQWQKQKEVNTFSADKWQEILTNCGFSVEFYEKDELCFFRCSNVFID